MQDFETAMLKGLLNMEKNEAITFQRDKKTSFLKVKMSPFCQYVERSFSFFPVLLLVFLLGRLRCWLAAW